MVFTTFTQGLKVAVLILGLLLRMIILFDNIRTAWRQEEVA